MTDPGAMGGERLADPSAGIVWLRLLCLGLWTGLDMTAVGQILVSQPLVSGWLGGWAVGDPLTGLAVGLLLQGVWIRSMPLGSSPLPMTGPAAVAAGALAGSAGGARVPLGPVLTLPDPLPLATALLLAIAIAAVGRRLHAEVWRRRSRILKAAEQAVRRADPGGVVRANLRGAIPSGLVGVALVAAGFAGGSLLLAGLPGTPQGDPRWVALPVLALGLGQTVSLAGGRRVWGWAVAAAAAGLGAALL